MYLLLSWRTQRQVDMRRNVKLVAGVQEILWWAKTCDFPLILSILVSILVLSPTLSCHWFVGSPVLC